MSTPPRRVHVRFTVGRMAVQWPQSLPYEWEETLYISADVWRENGRWYADNYACEPSDALQDLTPEEWTELQSALVTRYLETAEDEARSNL